MSAVDTSVNIVAMVRTSARIPRRALVSGCMGFLSLRQQTRGAGRNPGPESAYLGGVLGTRPRSGIPARSRLYGEPTVAGQRRIWTGFPCSMTLIAHYRRKPLVSHSATLPGERGECSTIAL